MSNFDIKKFLIENKLTINSRKVQEESVDSELAQDPRFVNRPRIGVKKAMELTKFYLDGKTKYTDYLEDSDEGYKLFVEPLGDPTLWEQDTAFDILDYYFTKTNSKWEQSIKNDEVGDRIYEILIDEFLEQVGDREFISLYDDYHSDIRHDMNN